MDSIDLAKALAGLARSATRDTTIDDMLRELCRVAVQAPNVDGAGVMVADGQRLRFVHADPSRVLEIEHLQESLQRGPCKAAFDELEMIVIGDISAYAERWPEFVEAAQTAGLAASVAVPLQARSRAWGVLDLYRNQACVWTAEELAVAKLFADVAASYFVMAADRDVARVARRSLEHLATHDELTGLPNRAMLFNLLAHALAGAGRRGTSVAALFIDLDRFKDVNDTLGHAAGDEVLAAVAARLNQSLRDSDTVARLAGDEFVVICEDLPGAPALVDRQLRQLGHRLNRSLSITPILAGRSELLITASVGIAVNGDHTTAEQLVGEADAAMYAAKQRGRGQVVVGDRRGDPSLSNLRSLERDLPDALARGELRVHYQPIVAAGPTHELVAVEALVRWQHPREGLLTAATFIQAAERSGEIVAIGRWVIDQAAAQMRAWQDQLGELAPPRVFVNMSPREVTHPELADALAAAMETYRLAPSSLGLEIVEAHFVDAQLVPCLAEHRRRGHPLAVDDFGTGYSSLARLVDLPVQYAKIDQSFVAGLPDDQRRRELVNAIVVVAHQLGLKVIGEGVESAAQAQALTAAGCDLLQGFYLGYPEAGDVLAERWEVPLIQGTT